MLYWEMLNVWCRCQESASLAWKQADQTGEMPFLFFKSFPDRRCRREICWWMQSTDTVTPFSQAQIGKCFVWCPFPWIDRTCIKQTLLRCYCIFTYRNRRWLVLWDTKTWPVLEYLLVCVSRATGFTLIFNAANKRPQREHSDTLKSHCEPILVFILSLLETDTPLVHWHIYVLLITC